jgi:SAM-dependent methyltransferase
MPTQQFWETRWQEHQTGWDLGQASPPLRAYIDQLEDKNISILIPGCGNAYEAAYLLEKGFTHVTLIDIAAYPVKMLTERFNPGSDPRIRIIHGDFFEHEGQYDLILEQTFFCALDPSLRDAYVQKMASLLKPGGKLVGVLFNRDFEGGPPFGGHIEEYRKRFAAYLSIKIMEPCYNSIGPRTGKEAFFGAEKKRFRPNPGYRSIV